MPHSHRSEQRNTDNTEPRQAVCQSRAMPADACDARLRLQDPDDVSDKRHKKLKQKSDCEYTKWPYGHWPNGHITIMAVSARYQLCFIVGCLTDTRIYRPYNYIDLDLPVRSSSKLPISPDRQTDGQTDTDRQTADFRPRFSLSDTERALWQRITGYFGTKTATGASSGGQLSAALDAGLLSHSVSQHSQRVSQRGQ